MRKLLHFSLLTLLATLMSATAMADEAGFVTEGQPNDAGSTGTITGKANEIWSYVVSGTNFHGTSNAYPQAWQIGSKNDPVESVTFSTNDISGTITKIDVCCSAYYSATVDVTVGGEAFGESKLSNSGNVPTPLSFEGSATGEIVITLTNTTSGYRYIMMNYITVTYTPTSSNKVAKPTFDPAAGEVASGTEVSFNCTTEGVTYYYTTDGTDPTISSSTSSSYIVNNNVTLKVMAVKTGMDNSDVATAAYTIAKTDPNLAFSETSVTANYGEDFTPPSLTYAEGYDGTITYSSSNSAISVNQSTGEVSFDASAIGKTTTITATASATDNFKSGSASYTLTVEATATNSITGNLNNNTFGTSYSGSITPITDFSSETGYIGNVKVTYAKGTSSNAYINNNEIRLYKGSLLTFIAPNGYCLKALIFNTRLTDCTSDVGSISAEVWNALEGEEVQEVTLTKTTNGNLALKSVTILLEQIIFVDKVTMNTDGYVTYVTKYDIDWTKTLAKNTSDVDVHGYKVVQFTQETALFGEFGVGDNEKLIPAGTPIIIKGKEGDNELEIASFQDRIVAPNDNKLYASDGTVTATAENHLLVFQKTSDWTEEDPYNNYAFFKLKEGRNIPEGKAYLKGEDVSEEITATTNAAMGIFLLEDLGKPQDTGTTGITQYSALQNGSMTNGIVYDLSGRKIAESLQRMKGLAKGIYIVNGRKVVIK